MIKKDAPPPLPHQEAFIASTLRNNGRIFGALPMGSGKTYASILAIEELHKENKAHNVLVIVPSSLKDNYIQALQKFSTGININEQTGGKTTRTIASGNPNNLTYNVISYELLRSDPDRYMMTRKGPINAIVADEVGRWRTNDSQLSQAMQHVATMVPTFIALSADPSSNSPVDILPIARAVIGKDFNITNPQEFEKNFMTEVSVQTPDGQTTIEKRFKNLEGLKELFQDGIFYINPDNFNSKYPKVEESIERVPMSPKQVKAYQYALGTLDPISKFRMEHDLPVEKRDVKTMFQKLIRAREVANTPASLTGEQDPNKVLAESPKIKKIVEDAVNHLNTTPDGQIFVYSNLLNSGVMPIYNALKAQGISVGLFVGKGKGDANRDETIQDFKKGKIKILIGSPAAREGISLPGVTMEQIVDSTYNPTVESQAKARGVRIDSLPQRKPEDRKVIIKKYVSTLPETLLNKMHITSPKNSVEEWVNNIATRKQKSNDELKQILNQLRKKEGPVITPTLAPPEIGVQRQGKGVTFAIRRRKLRSDKGEDRMPYRPRRES